MLFTPITINKLELKNRLVMAPMCTRYAQNGMITNKHIAHYGARALGQVGLIIVEATAIEEIGKIFEEDLCICDDKHIAGFTNLVQTVHDCGSKIGIQLAHAGRKSLVTKTPISASAIAFDKDSPTPVELNLEGIERIKNLFVQATKRAIQSGFDLIELHAAHGYLLNQFLSPLTNTRTDQYGGSPENRARLLTEIITQIRTFYKGALSVRISALDYHQNGLNAQDYVEILKDLDIDLIDVSTGGVVSDVEIPLSEGYQVPHSEHIKKHTDKIVSAVGLITRPSHAEEILQQQKADLVFLGRPLLRDSNWVINAAKELNVELTKDIFWARL